MVVSIAPTKSYSLLADPRVQRSRVRSSGLREDERRFHLSGGLRFVVMELAFSEGKLGGRRGAKSGPGSLLCVRLPEGLFLGRLGLKSLFKRKLAIPGACMKYAEEEGITNACKIHVHTTFLGSFVRDTPISRQLFPLYLRTAKDPVPSSGLPP